MPVSCAFAPTIRPEARVTVTSVSFLLVHMALIPRYILIVFLLQYVNKSLVRCHVRDESCRNQER